MNTAITYEALEEKREFALALAILVRQASQAITVYVRIRQLTWALNELAALLDDDCLDKLNAEERIALKQGLQELHKKLTEGFRKSERLASSERIVLRAEDIRDVIESLALRDHPDFHNLIAECANSAGVR